MHDQAPQLKRLTCPLLEDGHAQDDRQLWPVGRVADQAFEAVCLNLLGCLHNARHLLKLVIHILGASELLQHLS